MFSFQVIERLSLLQCKIKQCFLPRVFPPFPIPNAFQKFDCVLKYSCFQKTEKLHHGSGAKIYIYSNVIVSHFWPVFSFYTPTCDFLVFSKAIKWKRWPKWVKKASILGDFKHLIMFILLDKCVELFCLKVLILYKKIFRLVPSKTICEDLWLENTKTLKTKTLRWPVQVFGTNDFFACMWSSILIAFNLIRKCRNVNHH